MASIDSGQERYPLHREVTVVPFNPKIGLGYVEIGNTGLSATIKKIESGGQRWYQHYAPDEVISNPGETFWKNSLIYAYGFEKFITWWEEFDNWSKVGLAKSNFLHISSNSRMTGYISRLMGRENFTGPHNLGTESVYTFDLHRILRDPRINSRLGRLRARCAQSGFLMSTP